MGGWVGYYLEVVHLFLYCLVVVGLLEGEEAGEALGRTKGVVYAEGGGVGEGGGGVANEGGDVAPEAGGKGVFFGG